MAVDRDKAADRDVEIQFTKGQARLSLNLDLDAVTRCIEEDGTLTIRFEEIGSTILSGLPDSAVTEN